MPAASLIDSYLPAPFNRKVDFHAAFKASVEAAGFPAADIDVFDRADSEYVNSFGTTYFGAGTVGSIRGFVKEIVFNGSSKGTIQICFFTRTIRSTTYGGYGAAIPYLDLQFVPGFFIVQGGWNSTTKLPNNALSTISGWGVNSSPDSSASSFWGVSGAIGTLGSPLASVGGSGDRVRCILNNTNPIKFTAINHPEIRGVYIQQAEKLPHFIGVCRPTDKPATWDENIYPYVLASENSSFFTYRGFYGALSPYNTIITDHSFLNFPGCVLWVNDYNNNTFTEPGLGRTANPGSTPVNPINPANNNKREVITAPYIINRFGGAGLESSRWLLGQYSDDIVITNSIGLDFKDKIIVSPGTEEYTVITTPEVGNYSQGPSMSYRKIGDGSYYNYYVVALRTT
jgi:hypothetical protein